MIEDVRQLARAHAAAAISTLANIAADLKAPGVARVAACNSILDRGWGKPQAHVIIEEPGEVANAQRDQLRDMILASVAEMAGVCATIEKL